MGSPKYMAPEQILGGEITARTDIYSLGVMMYEMLTGRVPFDRGASVGTLMAHVNDIPPPMVEVNPKLALSRTMETIVTRCLEKEADRRFVSMKDLLASLKRVGHPEGSPMTDTHESMPIARIDVLGPPSGARAGGDSGPQTTSILHAARVADHRLDARACARAAARHRRDGQDAAEEPPLRVAPRGRRRRGHRRGGDGGDLKPHPGDDPLASNSAGNGGPAAGQGGPTTAPPTTATASAAADSASAARTVKIESDPAGASVTEGTTEVCASTPCDVVWKGDVAKGEHKLQLTKKGFKTTKLTVAEGDTKVSSKLDAVVAFVPNNTPRPPPPPPPDASGKRKPNPYGD